MPGGQWVAFDVSTDAPHEHNKVAKKRKTIPSSSIKPKKEPTQEVTKTYYKQSFTTEKSNFNGWFWVIFIIVLLFLIF